MDATALIKTLALIDVGLLYAGAIAGLLFFRKWHPALRWLTGYLIMVSIVETIAKLHVYGWLEGDNLYLLHMYTVAEYVLLSLMFQRIFQWKRGFIAYFTITTLGVVIYSLVNLLTPELVDPDHFTLYSKLLVSSTMVGYAVIFFTQSLITPARYLEHFQSFAYVVSGVMLYFSASFIIYLIINHLIFVYVSESLFFWLINTLLAFIFHFICLLGLWQKDSRIIPTSTHG